MSGNGRYVVDPTIGTTQRAGSASHYLQSFDAQRSRKSLSTPPQIFFAVYAVSASGSTSPPWRGRLTWRELMHTAWWIISEAITAWEGRNTRHAAENVALHSSR